MSPVEQFYADLDVQDTVTKRGRKATNMYFTATTEKAIVAYNSDSKLVSNICSYYTVGRLEIQWAIFSLPQGQKYVKFWKQACYIA